MGKQTHTPGPWVAEGRGANLTVVFAGSTPGSRPGVCAVADGTEKEREANARLIAAAPELLAALAAIVSRLEWNGYREGWDVRCDLPSGTVLAARAAIAKATAEQEA